MTEITGRSALAGDPSSVSIVRFPHNYDSSITPTKSQFSPKNKIPQWQSHKMRQLIIDRWQKTWLVVETRNKTKEI